MPNDRTVGVKGSVLGSALRVVLQEVADSRGKTPLQVKCRSLIWERSDSLGRAGRVPGGKVSQPAGSALFDAGYHFLLEIDAPVLFLNILGQQFDQFSGLVDWKGVQGVPQVLDAVLDQDLGDWSNSC